MLKMQSLKCKEEKYLKRVIIDRLEEGTAVCFDQNKNALLIDISLLPKGADEGCTLLIAEDGQIDLDTQDAQARRERIKSLEDQLFQ